MIPNRNREARADASARLGTWLSSRDSCAFASYARELHLEPSTLAALLAIRVIRSGKLPFQTAEPPSRGARMRLTTSLRDASARTTFRIIARAGGAGAEAALRALIKAELEQRWAERTLGNRIDSID